MQLNQLLADKAVSTKCHLVVTEVSVPHGADLLCMQSHQLLEKLRPVTDLAEHEKLQVA